MYGRSKHEAVHTITEARSYRKPFLRVVSWKIQHASPGSSASGPRPSGIEARFQLAKASILSPLTHGSLSASHFTTEL